ncbi:MAG: hypothetical protein U5L45_04095 [Saprospiraceae bacterium]|nr:hypothetical protein [Saprospiraceae bacterium]
MSFLDILFSHINANSKAGDLSKELIWASLYQNETYNDVRFRKLTSDLLKLIEDFLAQEKYEKDEVQKASYLLTMISEKKMEKLHNSAIKSAREILRLQNDKSASFYFAQYTIEKNYYDLSEGELRRSEKSNMENIINNLDYFYLAEKLRLYNSILSRTSMISHEYKLLFIDEIIEHIEKYQYNDVPPVSMYYRQCLTLMQDEEPKDEHYFELKKLVSRYWRQFPLLEANDIYGGLLNYCIRRLNKVKSDIFYQEFLSVYKEILENNILPNNELNPWSFKNAVQIALRLGEYEWTENLIKEYSSKLPAEFRDNAVSYNLALVYFYQKKYDKVIQQLQAVEYADIGYNLNAKSMLVAIYYELDLDDALMSQMDSFKTYLHRHKDIAENRRVLYLNLMKYVRKLLKLNKGNTDEIDNIKKEMEEDRKIGIASEKWILEKLAELA